LTVETYLEAAVQEGLWSSETALDRYLRWLFRDVPLSGQRVLDIGGGTGLLSFYAAARGAKQVVCLEPDADGASVGIRRRFARLGRALGLERVRLTSATFQAYESPRDSFDVVLLHNSINHLDEEATARLGNHPPSRAVYAVLFRKLATLLAPGGPLLVADCARTNLFPLLGLPHPISRTIEWHKHQDPALWAALLAEAGFREPIIGWSSYNRLGRFGWALLANRVGAFLGPGHFRLLMRLRPDIR
jgi:SAM-dependent methyltransferase